MKSKLVTLFVICTLFITTGCSTSNDIKQEENISTVIEDTNQTENKKSDKLIKLHQEMLPKIKDIYDSTGVYYTQLGGKYIFNTREFAHCYKTYKAKDING